MKTKLTPLAIALLSALAVSLMPVATSAAGLYQITPLGLTNTEHTRNDGYRSNSVIALSEAGEAVGNARRFNGGSADLGQSAWLFNGSVTTNIGHAMPWDVSFDPPHTRYDGYQNSTVIALNAAGQAAGNAQCYLGPPIQGYQVDGGQEAWVYTTNILVPPYGYSGWGTTEVGPWWDNEHNRSDGYHYLAARFLNATGQVAGVAQRFNGASADLGQSAWLATPFFDGVQLQWDSRVVGLTDTQHARNDGYRSNAVSSLNVAGQVAGNARRFNGGGTDLGQSAWFFNGSVTTNIGHMMPWDIGFDPPHTRYDGYQNSYVIALNAAGQAAGNAQCYLGPPIQGYQVDGGQEAWVYTTNILVPPYGYSGWGTTQVGPWWDNEHNRNDGYHHLAARFLNATGQVAGVAQRFNGGSTDLGQSAWLASPFFDGVQLQWDSRVVGLTDTQHTRNDGYRSNSVIALSEAGKAVGNARRFNGGSTDLGQSAWVFNGSVTTTIGLTGGEYTRSDGYQSNAAIFLNATGQVAGVAQRFNGGGVDLGQSAWVYDPGLNQTFAAPEFSLRADGYAFSQVTYLGDDGLALGSYKLYDGTNYLGDRAIRFTIADSWQDLGLLVPGGLTTNGWQYLANAFTASADGTIIGTGLPTSQSGGTSGYLLYMDNTPPVLNCPTDLALTNPPGQCEAVVTFTVTATDNWDPAPVVTCVPPSGFNFPVGRTTVLCTAVDACGNTNTSSFTVSVYPTQLIPAGETWTSRENNRRWRSITSSADGTKLVAVVFGGQIYTSTDSGASWTARESNREWTSVASSADGSKLVATEQYGQIYTSTNSGTNWTAATVPSIFWFSVASSADGSKLVAAPYNGLIYTSTDSGMNWTPRDITREWVSVTSSADGTKLVAGVQSGRIYTSTDSGTNWIARDSSRVWYSVASSADGSKLVAADLGGQIYTSTDSGLTWTPRESSRTWYSVASSADGSRLAAVDNGPFNTGSGGLIYVSSDSGVTWTPCATNREWISVASSADGTKLVAAVEYGQIYTSAATAVPLTSAPTILGVTGRVVEANVPGGAVVTFSVTATNVCQPNVPVTCTPPSGSLFPPGTNVVTCVAVDAFGVTNTASFTVTVSMPAPPVFAGCSMPAPGQFRPCGTGTPNLTYTLQSSTNLVDWVNRTNLLADPTGLIECLMDMETNAPACFYRLKWP